MLRSDFSCKAHANFQNYFLYAMCFVEHIGVKLTSISRKTEVHIESNIHFCVSIEVYNNFNATNIKITLF